MFNEEFYPTPAWLADKLVEPYNMDGKIVLDPQAGKGDLIDAVMRRYDGRPYYVSAYKPRVLCVEIEPELRSILQGKGYPVVGDDFLSYYPTLSIPFIIMNPPFKSCIAHFLHAWDILYAGELAAIMPTHALAGKTGKSQVLLKLLADNGAPEPELIGSPFRNGAERTTDAEVAIVRITKLARYDDRLDFEASNSARPEVSFSGETSGDVALSGFVDDLLQRFQVATAQFAEYKIARLRIQHYAAPFLNYTKEGDRADALHASDAASEPQTAFNIFVDILQEAAWTKLFDYPQFQKILTERARALMNDYRARQRQVDFNEYNIRMMFGELVARQGELWQATVDDAFDWMTKYHEENREHVEGWKSDHAWYVANRVVLPNCVRIGYSRNSYDLEYRSANKLNDVDRALCNVTGSNYDTITKITDALRRSFEMFSATGSRQTESTFFDRIRYYQKGTVHLYWRSEQQRKDFNIAAARGRGWLPPSER